VSGAALGNCLRLHTINITQIQRGKLTTSTCEHGLTSGATMVSSPAQPPPPPNAPCACDLIFFEGICVGHVLAGFRRMREVVSFIWCQHVAHLPFQGPRQLVLLALIASALPLVFGEFSCSF
jgi:hypothetical protein